MSTQSPAPADPTPETPAPTREQPMQTVSVKTILDRIAKLGAEAEAREKRQADAFRELTAQLDEANRTVVAMAERLDGLTRLFASLQAVVRAALPSQLLRLRHEDLRELADKVPHTRIRLLEPLKGPNLHLAAGMVLPVSDGRIAVYMSVVQAALVVDDVDDVAVHVRQIVAAEVSEQLTAAKVRAEQDAHTEADALEAQAGALRGLVGGAKEK